MSKLKCERCGAPANHAMNLDRLGSEPGYEIFSCTKCGHYTWIKQEQQPE